MHQRGGNSSGAAHLLHVGRQQRPGGQEHLLFVYHFSLTGTIVVGAWKKKSTQTTKGGLCHCSCTVGCMEPKKQPNKQIMGTKTVSGLKYQPGQGCLMGLLPLTCRDEVHVLAGSMQQQPLEAGSWTQTTEETGLLWDPSPVEDLVFHTNHYWRMLLELIHTHS